jgi:hypothetical protein
MTIAAYTAAVFVGVWLAFNIAVALAAVLLERISRSREGGQ